LITTRNRKEELRAALLSAFEQTGHPEVLVIDDGSTDGTADMVRAEFPEAVLHRCEESRGLIVRRNEGARLAKGEVIFSIDDDAAFSTPHVVEQTLRDFVDPRIGAIAIPYLEPHKDKHLLQKAPDRESVWITDRFIGTAHALRRDIFLKLGGYREHLVHQGEESDYCIRMLDARYFVRLGNADPIHHFESPKRDFRRMDYYGHRNLILFAWCNVPLPPMLVHLAATTLNCTRSVLRQPSHAPAIVRGVCAGYARLINTERKPVRPASYRLYRRLRKSRAITMQEVEELLPANAASHEL
jgi:glycosyltransferase involved in cell wall biosynthesis